MRPTTLRLPAFLAALRAPSTPPATDAGCDDLALGMESALPALQGLLPLVQAVPAQGAAPLPRVPAA
jgi:hypothetical protein